MKSRGNNFERTQKKKKKQSVKPTKLIITINISMDSPFFLKYNSNQAESRNFIPKKKKKSSQYDKGGRIWIVKSKSKNRVTNLNGSGLFGAEGGFGKGLLVDKYGFLEE